MPKSTMYNRGEKTTRDDRNYESICDLVDKSGLTMEESLKEMMEKFEDIKNKRSQEKASYQNTLKMDTLNSISPKPLDKSYLKCKPILPDIPSPTTYKTNSSYVSSNVSSNAISEVSSSIVSDILSEILYNIPSNLPPPILPTILTRTNSDNSLVNLATSCVAASDVSQTPENFSSLDSISDPQLVVLTDSSSSATSDAPVINYAESSSGSSSMHVDNLSSTISEKSCGKPSDI